MSDNRTHRRRSLPSTKCDVHHLRFARLSLALATAGLLTLPTFAQVTPSTLPSGGVVAAGTAGIRQDGSAMRIDQTSNKAIIDWRSFNIGRDANVRFHQPSSSSIVLNRVGADGGRSIIDGSLSANGRVWLLNPGGVLFSNSARVDVGGLLSSSLKLDNANFLSGNYRFTQDGTSSIINQGHISAADGGYVALLAPEVRNEGVISARLGAVALVSGEQLRVDFSGDHLIEIAVDRAEVNGLVENKHLVQADGGWVLMSTDAQSRLAAGAVNNSGVVQAQTIGQHDGVITLFGGTATVNGTLDASAPNGGDGGFIETSGRTVNVASAAQITTAAAQGKTGMWLIDPNDFVIGTGGNINGADLSKQLDVNNVTIQTSSMGSPGNGDILVSDNISWSPYSSSTVLTLQAERDITVNQQIYGSALHVEAGRNVLINNRVQTTGNMSVTGRDIRLQASSSNTALLSAQGDQTITASGELRLTGATSGQQKSAEVRASGNQSVSANIITLQGGGQASGDVDNSATIRHNDCSSSSTSGCMTPTGSGNQSIYLTGSHAQLIIVGGAGDGRGVTYSNLSCVTAGLGDICYGSGNVAGIDNSIGNQTITFNNGGGLISIRGGSNGTGNDAHIFNNQWSTTNANPGPLPGEQKIIGVPNIALTGGTSGGRSIYASNAFESLENSAAIRTDGPVQSITANNLTLNGNGSGAAADTLGGVFVGGDPRSGNLTQTISVAGNLSITGGTSGSVAATNDSTKLSWSSPAGIYADARAGTATSNISVTGNVTLTGGSSYSPVFIGSKHGAALNIRATGTILLDTGANHSAVLLGSYQDVDNANRTDYPDKIVFGSMTGSSLTLQSDATGDAIQLYARNGNLINQASTNILSTYHGRWLLYAASPSGEVLGGIPYDFIQYNTRFGDTVSNVGNGLLYASTNPNLTPIDPAVSTATNSATSSVATAVSTQSFTTTSNADGGGASMSNFPANKSTSTPTTTNTDTTTAAAPLPKLIVDAAKSVPTRAGVLDRSDQQALTQQIHEARGKLFADALAQLAQAPNAANIPDCASSNSELCIAKSLMKVEEGYAPVVKRKFALLIGNNAYRSPIPELETAINDVTAVAAELRDKLGYEVKIIEDAQRKDIIEALNGLIRNTGQDDSVLVMYAGHGYLNDKNMGYWIPTDADVHTPDKWISNETIARALGNIPAKQVMLVSDSCYSGSLTKEGKVLQTVGVNREQALTRRSVLAMSSGGEEPVSDEGYDNHSIFAWNLIQSLRKMPGELSGQQLYAHIKEEVTKEFPQVPQYGIVTSAGHKEGGEYLLTPKN